MRRSFLLVSVAVTSCGSCRDAKRSPPAIAEPAPVAAKTSPAPEAGAKSAIADAAPDAAVSAACKAMMEATRAAWRKVPSCGDAKVWEKCLSLADGSWGIEVGKIDDNGNEPTTACTFDWQLVYVDRSGRRDAKTFRGLVRAGRSEPTQFAALGDDGVFLGIHSVGAFEELAEDSHYVYLAREGKIVAHPGLGAREVVDVADLDGDGKTDFVLKSPFVVKRAIGRSTSMHHDVLEGPRTAAHVLADGALSFDDRVAQEVARKDCPARPPPRPPARPDGGKSDPFEGTATWIACSRYWGIPSAAIEAALEKECTSYEDVLKIDTGTDLAPYDDSDPAKRCPTFFSAWADVKVPFVLE